MDIFQESLNLYVQEQINNKFDDCEQIDENYWQINNDCNQIGSDQYYFKKFCNVPLED